MTARTTSKDFAFPKDRIRKTVKKFDEKRNEKRVETGQIGKVTERRMDPVIQYTGRKVRGGFELPKTLNLDYIVLYSPPLPKTDSLVG